MADKFCLLELKRIFRLPFFIGIVSSAACFYLDELEFIKMAINNPMVFEEGSVACVLHYITASYTAGGVFCSYLLPIFVSLSYSVSYCTEENNHMVGYIIFRSGKRKYGYAKTLTATISGGLTALVGSLLFVIVLSTRLPLTTPQYIVESQILPFSSLLSHGGGLLYLLVVIYLIALSGALWSEAGMWISAYLPNPYVVLSFPMLLKFLMVQTGRLLRLPDALRLDYLLSANARFFSDGITLVVVTFAVVGIVVLMGRDFQSKIEGRIENAS
jgi:membrane protein